MRSYMVLIFTPIMTSLYSILCRPVLLIRAFAQHFLRPAPRKINWLASAIVALGLAPTVAFAQTPITISPSTLPNAVVSFGTYSVQLTATGGTGTKTFAVTNGALPPGLSLTSSGLLSGVIPTSTTGGVY